MSGTHAVRLPSAWLCACLVWALVACVGSPDTADLQRIYSRSAQSSDDLRNPVILIPGIGGSRLAGRADDRTVWGAFTGDYANPASPSGARRIALPMEPGHRLSELRDEVAATGALDRLNVSVFGVPVEVDAYRFILAALGVGGYRDETLAETGAVVYGDEHFTCFQFAYDWRRDLVESAGALDAFIQEKRAYVQEELARRYGVVDADVKFDIVAHSAGALLTRYYLRFGSADLPGDDLPPEPSWAGAERVERVILVAPPNAGAIKSLLDLTRGLDVSLFVPDYPPAVLETFPSGYQLLPRTRHRMVVDESGTALDLLSLDVWERMGWGLADPDQDEILWMLLPDVAARSKRRAIALDHLGKSLSRARRFAQALDLPAQPPPGVELFLFAGDAIPTPATVVVGPSEMEVVTHEAGDGTVLRSSALMDERVSGEWSPKLVSPIDWDHVIFLPTEHLGVTRDPAFTDNVLHLLLERPTRRPSVTPPTRGT